MTRFLVFFSVLALSFPAYMATSNALGFGLAAFAVVFLLGFAFKVLAHAATVRAVKLMGPAVEGNPVMRRVLGKNAGEALFTIIFLFLLVFISGLLLIVHGFNPQPLTGGAAVMSALSTAEAAHDLASVRTALRSRSGRVTPNR